MLLLKMVDTEGFKSVNKMLLYEDAMMKNIYSCNHYIYYLLSEIKKKKHDQKIHEKRALFMVNKLATLNCIISS